MRVAILVLLLVLAGTFVLVSCSLDFSDEKREEPAGPSTAFVDPSVAVTDCANGCATGAFDYLVGGTVIWPFGPPGDVFVLKYVVSFSDGQRKEGKGTESVRMTIREAGSFRIEAVLSDGTEVVPADVPVDPTKDCSCQ